jgi:hypothetical protein
VTIPETKINITTTVIAARLRHLRPGDVSLFILILHASLK